MVVSRHFCQKKKTRGKEKHSSLRDHTHNYLPKKELSTILLYFKESMKLNGQFYKKNPFCQEKKARISIENRIEKMVWWYRYAS